MIIEPSQSIIEVAANQRTFDEAQVFNVLEQWDMILGQLTISSLSFLIHRDKGDLAPKGLMEFHYGLDLFDIHGGNEKIKLATHFYKDGVAHVGDKFFSGEEKEDHPALYEKYASFLGFKGTWEEVARKIIELNDIVVAENTPPSIPNDLRENLP